MCITLSVGDKGKNRRNDVLTIQILLNLNLHRLIPYSPSPQDGKINDQTTAMIQEFQIRIMNMAKPDRKVDPRGKTLAALREGIPDAFSQEKLQGIMINATEATVKKYFSPLQVKMPANEINTPMRTAHFLAQLGHESGEFRYSEEIASGAAYEGRKDLGNTQKGDGKRFKGRGLIQLTGRANYKAYGDATGKDFTTDDTAKLIATDAELAVDVSCWFWKTHKLNSLADADNVTAITKRINGGYNGLEDRKAKLVRAKFFLKVK